MRVVVCNVLDIFPDQLFRPHAPERHPRIRVVDFDHSSHFAGERRIPASTPGKKKAVLALLSATANAQMGDREERF
jgi:hypothetical protein